MSQEPYPVDLEPYSSRRQPIGAYPSGTRAVRPEDIAPYDCDHDADPPVCVCVHDWRIHWGNPPRKVKGRNVFVTDAP